MCLLFCWSKATSCDAVKWLGRYLKGTRDKGMILKPTGTSFDVYMDANFACNWKHSEAKSQDTARSQHGYIILYAGCPILWVSQLQTEIMLSSTESEFIGLSNALHATIPIMELVKELKGQGVDMVSTQPMVHCCVFEDNSGALKIAKVPKMRPHTKHINHFWDYVERGEIPLHTINTHDQPADMLTKPLAALTLAQHCATIMGWGRKGNAERECEDIHCGMFQQCHQPAGNSFSTKSMQGRSNRPLRKVMFSQSGPTMIRPDLNNFLA